VLSSQTSVVDTQALQSAGQFYTLNLSTDTTKLVVALVLDQKTQGVLKTMILSSDDLTSPGAYFSNIKVVSILADSAINSSLQSAKINIPYSLPTLNGLSESSLMVYRLDQASGQWWPCTSSVDTVNHQIQAETKELSTFGVFIRSTTPVARTFKSKTAFGIRADFMPQTRGIALSFTLPSATDARCELYNIQGKCLRTTVLKAREGTSLLLWQPGTCASGRYFLKVKAGTYSIQKPVLMIR
jgi:hypothetical protein